jgi:two-component system, response regulator YesN
MIYNVIIVDDEPKIRLGIASSIDWNGLGLNLIGTACDGQEALNIAKTQKIDICIADICMPFIDGLDLIDKLKEINPAVVAIIISGYDKFEYAKNAMKLKVFDYMLKPINENALLATVQRAISHLEENTKRQKSMLQAKKELDKSMPYLRERFLLDCIRGEIDLHELNELKEFYEIPLFDHTCVMLVKVDEVALLDTKDEKDKQIMIFALQATLENLLDRLPCYFCIRNQSDDIIVLAEATADWDDYCRKLPEMLQNQCGYKNRMYFSELIKFSAIAEAYEQLVKQATEDKKCTPMILNVKAYMEEHYSDSSLSLNSTAEKMNINLYYLSRLFKSEMSISFSNYLTKIRVGRAIKLMHDDDLKIYEIAEKVGYNSQHYFSSAFKRVLGVTPSEYKIGLEKTGETDEKTS